MKRPKAPTQDPESQPGSPPSSLDRAGQLVSLAHNLCDQGRPGEAEDTCRFVLSQSPRLPSALVALGRARLEQGHLNEARTLLGDVVARNPTFFAAHRWYAEVLVRLGDWPRASEVLLKAEALFPGQPRIAELVSQVMGTHSGSSNSPTGERPVPGPAPTSPRPRQKTYEGPAVPEEPSAPVAAPPPHRTSRGMPVPSTRPPPTRSPSQSLPLPGSTAPRPSAPGLPASGEKAPRRPRSSGSLSVPPPPVDAPFPPATSPAPVGKGAPSGVRPATIEGRPSRPSQPAAAAETPLAQPNWLDSSPRGDTPTRRHQYGDGAPGPVGGARVGLGRLWRKRLVFWQWAMGHPRVALGLAGLGIFAAAALTVVFISALLRPDPATSPESQAPTLAETTTPAVRTAAGPALSEVVQKSAIARAPVPTAAVGEELLATALLAVEYGRPTAAEAAVWARELAMTGDAEAGGLAEVKAAAVLLAVGQGDLAVAETLARDLGVAEATDDVSRFADGRRLSRQGEIALARGRVGLEAADSPFLPLRLLAVELAFDGGAPAEGMPTLEGILADLPHHPLGVQLLLEGRRALDLVLGEEEEDFLREACAPGQAKILTLVAACHIHRGALLRQQGRRRSALEAALEAARLSPADPRLLGQLGQLLANLGATRQAATVVETARTLADPKLPPLAWARAGIELATNRRLLLPEGPPPGPEARLIAARAAFVGPKGVDHARRVQASESATRGDADLRWIVNASDISGRRQARAMTRRIERRYGRRPPGPVASFVAGTMARRAGKKPMAQAWLSKALRQHGDACRAASLYRMSLQESGISPWRIARLQRAIGHLDCLDLPRSP